MDEKIIAHREMKNFSYSRVYNYRLLVENIDNYYGELSLLLELSRNYELKHFFREHNDKMLFYKKFFSDINDEQLKHIIEEKINNQIKINLINAKKYLLSKNNNA